MINKYKAPTHSTVIVTTKNTELASFSKAEGFASCDLELPQVSYDLPAGERLLVILSHATEEDTRRGRLGDSAQGSLVKTLIEQVHKEIATGLRDDLPNIKEVSVINFRDKMYERVVVMGTDYETSYNQAWVARVMHYVDQYKPTRILISGEGAFQAILYHSQTQVVNHQDFNNRIEYTEPFLLVGRVFNFVYNGIEIPTSFTLPFHWTATSNPKYIEEAPTLIHQQKFHLEHLLYGRNLYTVSDKSTWNRVDIMDLETFNVFYTQLRQAKKVAIDLETDNLARYANRILTAHFCLDGYTAYNIPICHRDTPLKPEEVTFIQQQLKAYLQDGDSVEHVYHNAKFDIGVLTAQLGLDFYNHKVFDTCGGVFCLDENVRTYKHFKTHPYNLRRVAYQYGCAAYDEGEVGKQDRTNMANLPLLEIFEYASKDVIIPYQVSAFQEAEAVRRKYVNWKAFLVDQLGAMTLVFVGMENKGILINKKYLIDLCSNDGTVQKLLNQVLDQFKQSPAARSVNEILVTRDRVITALKEEKNKLKRSLTLLKKQIKTLEKPRRILKKDEKDAELVASIMQQNTINARLYQQLQGIDKLYNEAVTSIGYVHDTIDKDVYKLKDYDLLVNSKNLSTSLQQIMKMLPSGSEFQPFIDGINFTQGRLSTLQSFRDIPVDVEVDWVFSVSTNECQQLLFFNVLGLDPVDVKKNGGGTTDKDFQDSYLHVPEVGYLATYNKYKKLMSTYIEGMMKRLESDPDSRLDGRLRADYGYRDVLTGRSSSRNPNFQNIVQRGELSKIVKSQFVAGKGEIYIKNDYNAAEVRQWANISQDYKLAATFRTGMVMRRELFLETDPVKREALQAKIKGEGDVHRLNYAFFFGKDPKDVTDEERTAVKAVIFGVMYGKSSFTLARDLKCSEEEAQKLLDKLFSTYDVAGNWIKQTKITTVNTLTAKSPIGRIRHLAAVLHHNTEVKSSTERKMCNSITQGFSSDMGYAGGRILQQIVYLLFQKQGYPLHLYENNTVHDSVEAITKFEHLPLSLYLVEQAFTTLMHLKYKQAFGMNWVIESEMDSELGCSIGTVRKFDWYKLPTLVREELTASQNVLGYHYTEEEKSEILRKFDHNYSIITRLKQLEVKQYLDFIKENPQQIYLKTVLLDKEKFDKVKNLLIF